MPQRHGPAPRLRELWPLPWPQSCGQAGSLTHEALRAALAYLAAPRARVAVLARFALEAAAAGKAPFAAERPPDVAEPDASAWSQADRQTVAIEQLGLHVVPIWTLAERLHKLASPPLLLFVRGDPALLHKPAQVLVGARRASPGPLAWAHDVARRWAEARTLVVSGGALGIDAAAHAGALAGGGATLAYLGTPIDRIYPALNAPLFRRMLAAGGALASEHPPLSVTYKSAHALRNRLIAAHAQQLVVAEAELRSGTASAVGYARRCGTPVRCAPAEVGGARAGLEDFLQRGWATVLAAC